jgi:hypothetical protein
MAKRRGNPNWGKPEPLGKPEVTVTAFEQVIQEWGLTPDQILDSRRLRDWAKQHKNQKYIPEELLEAWGLDVNIPE